MITVTAPVKNPVNPAGPVGTPFSHLIEEACGGFNGTPARVISGGPMMGFAQYDMSVTMGKASNCVLCLSKEDLPATSANPTCIRCARCVNVCPMHLTPLFMNMFAKARRWSEVEGRVPDYGLHGMRKPATPLPGQNSSGAAVPHGQVAIRLRRRRKKKEDKHDRLQEFEAHCHFQPHASSPVGTKNLMQDVLIAPDPRDGDGHLLFGPRALTTTLVSVIFWLSLRGILQAHAQAPVHAWTCPPPFTGMLLVLSAR